MTKNGKTLTEITRLIAFGIGYLEIAGLDK
jgi:hypothetical protein